MKEPIRIVHWMCQQNSHQWVVKDGEPSPSFCPECRTRAIFVQWVEREPFTR